MRFTVARLILAILLVASSGLAQAAAAPQANPALSADARKGASYLFYLHGRIVEDQGPQAVSEQFGPYRYDAILTALRARGFTVVSEVRPKDTDVVRYAEKIVGDIKRLLDGGVSPQRITVVGASKGGLIGLYVSSLPGRSDVNFVLIGICPATMEPAGPGSILLRGRVLTIRDVNDKEYACSAEPLARTSRGKGLSAFKEIVLQVGTGHGILYNPLAEWIDPVVEWAGLTK